MIYIYSLFNAETSSTAAVIQSVKRIRADEIEVSAIVTFSESRLARARYESNEVIILPDIAIEVTTQAIMLVRKDEGHEDAVHIEVIGASARVRDEQLMRRLHSEYRLVLGDLVDAAIQFFVFELREQVDEGLLDYPADFDQFFERLKETENLTKFEHSPGYYKIKASIPELIEESA